MMTIFVPLAPLLPQQEEAEAQAVASTLERVTVYSGQALVERTFEITVAEAGAATALVGPLPMAAAASSVQARIDDGLVVIQGLEMRQRNGALDETARDALFAQMEAVQRQLRELESGQKAVAVGRGLIDAVVTSVQEGGLKDLGTSGLSALFNEVAQQAQNLDQEKAAQERRRELLLTDLADLQKRLGSNQGAVRPYQEARISLFFQQRGTARVRLSYLVSGSYWEPVYDVRLDPELTRVQVGLAGRVRQDSGEDWDDVALALSTARPMIGLDPPPIPRRWVHVAGNRPARSIYGENDMAMTEALGYLDDSGAASGSTISANKDAYEAAPVVTVNDLGLSQQFQLPDQASVLSNGQPKKFRLVEVPLEVRPERYVVPSLSTRCFLRAEVTSSGDAPLLPGPAKVFLGPDYLGEATFPVLRPGDSTMLNLGVDPNLSIEFERVIDERDEPGTFKSTVKQTRVYEARLSLSRSASRAVEVLIEEVIPVSQDDRLKITPYKMHAGALDTKEDRKDREERGIWRWRVRFEPGQERVLRWGYIAAFHERYTPTFGNR